VIAWRGRGRAPYGRDTSRRCMQLITHTLLFQPESGSSLVGRATGSGARWRVRPWSLHAAADWPEFRAASSGPPKTRSSREDEPLSPCRVTPAQTT